MTESPVYFKLLKESRNGSKRLVVLIDPDDIDERRLGKLIEISERAQIDYFFVGGSLILRDNLNDCVSFIKQHSQIPVILFPGSNLQINHDADALLFLSLISGRNAEALIGQHVVAAPYLKESSLEVISTGYILIDGGVPTTVSYMSCSTPIPSDKPEIAVCTALAGQMLGMKLIYMDAGSGAKMPVSYEMISQVRNNIEIPLIVGGGIKTPEKAEANCEAGADIIVIGNALEKDPGILTEISLVIHSNQSVI